MRLQFISAQHVEEAVKYLAGKGHLPYTDADGTPNHRLMGAAWAALHGGYRGNKYQGPDKGKALARLKAVYKSEKMDLPSESFAVAGEFFQEGLAKSDSFDSIRCAVMDAVMNAINAKIRAGIDMDGDDDGRQDAIEGKHAWCMDIFPEDIVYSMDGKLFQVSYSFDQDDQVELGEPTEVETSYTPVEDESEDEEEEEDADGETQESFRVLACNAVPLQESDYDAASGKLTMTVIKPGLNRSKARFYPAETLKRDFHVFENAKMFADHQSDKESKERPEGSVHNWVAQINKVWPEADGTIKATAAVIDPPFKAKLDALAKQGLLHEMGISIRAVGEASEQEREGVTTNVVESLLVARSVDFVTYAGAGGQIEAMESAKQDNETDVDLVTEAVLRKRRPDLIRLVEKHAQQETKVKSLEQQLQEVTAENTNLKTRIAAAEKTAAKTAVAAELTKQLSESKLPEIAQARIRKQFAEAEKADGIKEAIAEEQEYVKKLGSAAPGKKNLGTADNGTTREADSSNQKPNLEEAFALLPGMSKDNAKVAASL